MYNSALEIAKPFTCTHAFGLPNKKELGFVSDTSMNYAKKIFDRDYLYFSMWVGFGMTTPRVLFPYHSSLKNGLQKKYRINISAERANLFLDFGLW